MSKEASLLSLEQLEANFLTSKVTSYVCLDGKIYGYIPYEAIVGMEIK